MPRSRETHGTKSLAEKKQYWNNVIRSASGPTVEDTTPIIDTTDHSAVAEREQTGSVTITRRPPAVLGWLKEKITEILIGAALLLLSWILFQLYGLNREVGELRTTPKTFESQVKKVEDVLSEKIRALSSDLYRLEQRMDSFFDRNPKDRNKSNIKKQE
jgi:hypothetical protein